MRNILIVAGGVVAVVAIALVLVLVRSFTNQSHARGAAPQVVKVAQATSGDMPETLTELGTVSPIATVTVLPQLSGYLTEVGYREGEDVTMGQFLAQIDPRQYDALYNIGMVEARTGHPEEARRAFTQYVETAPKVSHAADIAAARKALAELGSH